MSIALSNLRTHKSYVLTNYGEKFEFSVQEIMPYDEFLLKDVNTLETYYMSELIGRGKGKDFSIWER
ncbi:MULTISPECIES: hypothetical protein [Reichenbachiella]|uniref:Uncharacterized protein n=1 Tax=Reichenbachiella agariperforans TaxID=156994 RepID=A0A1M6UYQ5_REIAG|nr:MULTISPECIES: hypothetical protein [Reichenbachiella]MBU2912420.1 hypothetical protein [Reichenbachiella agariperforans]RJE72710.1 hypothetical protein BGP76_01730 [Reichenbachiella sp. MSK19-1]SHK74284.1 hypothetical protein SAMN04488028_10849 [Reichenbachiella agariperforans]